MYCLRRLAIILLLMIFLPLVLGSCSKTKENGPDGNDQKEKKIVIGYSMDTLVHERWLRDRDIFMARANELGAEVILQVANSDSAEQEKQVQYLLDQNIDILVLVPHDADEAADMVKAAKNKGVKVISYDRLVKKANVDLYISFDNVKVGELMGQAAIENSPTGNYLILNGSKKDNNSFMFNKGYMSALNYRIESGIIQVIGETWVDDWMYENALSFVEEALRSGERIDAIIAANDTLAGASVQALAEKRLAGKVTVIGHDADLDGCQRVVEGTQYATVYKPIDVIARTAAEFAVKMARGGLIQANDTINDGKYDVPYYKIEPILVTSENMVDVIIKDQFHRLEDVYMNIPKSQWPKIE